MRRPTILLDVDGPLTGGFLDAACEALRDLGVTADPAACTDWDFSGSFGATAAQEAAMYARLRRSGVAASFMPHPGARPFLEWLRRWADVVAVTAPLPNSRTWAWERGAWLARLGFGRGAVVSADAKHLVRGDAFVDDRPRGVQEWAAAWPEALAVLWGEPYNELTLWDGPRVCGFGELAGLLEANLRA